MEGNEKVKKINISLIAIIAILAFIIISLEKFAEKDLGHDVQSMIGREYAGAYSISVRDNYILKSAINIYIQTIHSGDLAGAYEYLLPQYKNHVSQDIYEQKMREIGLENFVIKNMTVEQCTEKMFSFDVELKNEIKLKLLIILDDKNYYIVPEPFLDYKTINKEITKKGVTYQLKGYQVDLERCIFDMTITNSGYKEVEIYEVKMTDTYGVERSSVNTNVKIAPNETKDISFLVETSIDFPYVLDVVRRDEDKVMVYTFELD